MREKYLHEHESLVKERKSRQQKEKEIFELEQILDDVSNRERELSQKLEHDRAAYQKEKELGETKEAELVEMSHKIKLIEDELHVTIIRKQELEKKVIFQEHEKEEQIELREKKRGGIKKSSREGC